MPMTPRENLMAVINHQRAEWVPNAVTETRMLGAFDETFDVGPLEGGYDGYGVLYALTPATVMGTSPDPRHIVLDDVTEWKEKVKFPDLDAFDWQGMADKQLAGYDPDQQVTDYWHFYGPFQRLASLLGFEEAIIQLALEPEACYELMSAVIDFRIKALPYIKKYLNPDIYTLCDDVAHELGTFISPQMYRDLIMPHHKRLLDAAKEYGMIPAIHCCGKADSLVSYFIEAGAVIWTPVQSMNDIEGVLEKYGDQIVVIGGYDNNGRPGNENTPVEEILAEVQRCFDTYPKYGSYMFMGSVLTTSMETTMSKMMPLIQKSAELARSTPAVYRPRK